MRRPVNNPYTITTEFGVKDSYAKFGFHSGIDYAVPTGRPIYAPIGGKVVYARMHRTGGNMVIIHDGQFYHRLLHNSTFSISEGTQVTEGQEVAKAGTTGLSTGPHCHWDINTRGVEAQAFTDFVSPARWLNSEFVVPRPTPHPVPSPAPGLQPYQRKVAEAGVNHREQPNTTSGIRKEWAAGEILDFKGFVRGQNVSGNSNWFVGKHTGGYLWSGSFVDVGTHDLPDITPVAAPKPDVAPAVEYSKRPASLGTWAVDVSVHQKSLDFKALKEQGIDIAILKAGHTGASYGGDVNKSDSKLNTFRQNARDNGVAIGYYWYCYFDEDAETEAGRFVTSVGSNSEPLFADVEEVKSASESWLKTFLETVEKLSGRTCHIYTYSNYLQNHPWIHGLLGQRKLWLAHYDIPVGTMAHNPIMHQYTSKGVLLGVGSQYIDLNLFFGTVDNFKKLGEPVPVEPKPAPIPVDSPPAPIPTKENNPIRPKVKAAGLAGLVLTVLLGVLNSFYPGNAPDAVDVAPLIAALTTIVTVGAGYLKRDGLSPK